MGDQPDALEPHVFADADLGGCTTTQRSTSGEFMVLRGRNSYFPIRWVAKRQSAVSPSSAEAEIYAAFHAVKNGGIPMLTLWDAVLDKDCVLYFHEYGLK